MKSKHSEIGNFSGFHHMAQLHVSQITLVKFRGVGAGGWGGCSPPIFRLGGAEPPQYLTSNITL